ncbi:MAG: asparagine synthase (glutamine-hydrolyzing) [Ruminococcaceae bacterium]|nr:asparagine synthase (glutamine-hydrolyzing) [Oscillospiraceae bacterium]
MCGFCGFTGQLTDREGYLRQMTRKITHRGPDSDGYYLDDAVALGFRRLSIIDIEAASQPLYNEDKTLILMFNGEIYNYRELRCQLQQEGHTFATAGDGEVLVHGYEQWGEELLPRLRGMFAFVVWDTREQSLFIARDYFGIKPMHYTRLADGRLVFGSEIKSLLEHPDVDKVLDETALDGYLSFQYAVPTGTFFKGISCLPPAHYLRYRQGEVTVHRYWEPTFDPDETMSLEQAVEAIDRVFTDSVAAHRISDVEVGCFLSSGVDSSYVASYFAGQKAFTVGFDNGQHYNESHYAAELAAEVGIRHYTHLITEEEYWDSLPTVQYYLDQPLADPSCVALYFVSKLAAQQVKVVLSGEGADELFGGYRIYHEPLSLQGYQRLPRWCRRAIGAMASLLPDVKGKSFLVRGSQTLEERFIGNARMFNRREKARLLRHVSATEPATLTAEYYARCQGQDEVTRMQYLDINRWMVGDILLKADRMSMAHSLELRVPFLDREVFRVASRIPSRHRIAAGTTKYAMRLAAARHIPAGAANKPKLGFPVPIRVWLRQERYYQKVREAFLSPTAHKYFHTSYLLRLLDAHYRGKKDNSRKIWTVYMFLVWHSVYFDD